MNVEQLMECKLSAETKVLGETSPQCHCVHRQSMLPKPGWNSGRRAGKPVTDQDNFGS
jgi:hypothetical protein